MKIIETVLEDVKLEYLLDNIAPLENVLFIDIETTGLSPKSSYIYMIGAIYYKFQNFHLIQWFSEDIDEEINILENFNEFSESYTHLVHYNGNQFDIPFLITKFEYHNISNTLSNKVGIDIYKRILPYKRFLNLPNCKQKTVENFLEIAREDIYSGRELISMYKEYMLNPSDSYLTKLSLHNAEDVLGLVKIMPILSYCDMIYGEFNVTKVNANTFLDNANISKQELIINIRLNSPVPFPITYYYKRCYFSANEYDAFIKVPIIQKELKFYYSNYSDYYYLPIEDVAIHKTVAVYVDSQNRIKATPSTCYTRKESSFLPQWEILVEPFFKESYRSDTQYFEITEELKKNRDFFRNYAIYILEKMST